MNYTEEMILRSSSGYAMPFSEENATEPSLGYGEQLHPETGETFFHHGLDFAVQYYPIMALATGTVCNVGVDPVHGLSQTIRYGLYEVTYGHLSNIRANFGETVKAGQIVAVSEKMLHMEVHYKTEEINPYDFLAMLYGNLMAELKSTEELPQPEFVPTGELKKEYRDNMTQIENLLALHVGQYVQDLQNGVYTAPPDLEPSLVNILQQAAARNFYFEQLPSYSNPLGLGARSSSLISKVESLIIGDFLRYMSQIHGVSLQNVHEDEKKKII